MAKKTTSRKKKSGGSQRNTRKKTSTRSKAAAKKKAPAKKTAARNKKKPTTRKKTGAAKKKTTTRKKAAAKKTPKKKTTKKAAPSKKTASKKPTTRKKAAGKKAPGSKASASKTPAAEKKTQPNKSRASKGKGVSPNGEGKKQAADQPSARPRFGSWAGANVAAGQEAAKRLAAAAGLESPQKSALDPAAAGGKTKRLTKSPLTKKQLRDFRELLLAKRREILTDVSAMESGALTGGESGSLSRLPQHMADQGSDTYDQSLALDLAASQRTIIREIDEAIARIDNNTFGICESLGTQIHLDRLRAEPWARYSIEAARMMERSGRMP